MAPLIGIVAQIAVSLFISASIGIASRVLSGATSKQQGVANARRRDIPRAAEEGAGGSPLSQQSDPGGPQIGVLGRRRVGGRVQLSARSGTVDYLVLVLAGDAMPVNAVYINNALVSLDSAGNVTTAPWSNGTTFAINIRLYTGAQVAADPLLRSAFPGWTAAMIGRRQTYARIQMRTTGYETAFQAGTPDFTFDVSGFPVYDPRNDAHDINAPSTWSPSSNAALVAAAYLMHDLGRELAPSSIDWDSVRAAANVCDELVPLASGLSEARYSCAAYWLTNEAHETVLAKIESAMAGHVYLLGSKYRIDAGKFDATGAVTITPNDYVGDGITFADTPPLDSIANGVRGRFASPTNNFELRDFPAYQDAAALAEDGGRDYWLSLDLPFVTSAGQAQRIARIAYHRTRKGSPVSVTTRFAFFDVVRGDIVQLNDTLAGLTGTYRVQGESLDADFAIDFDLTAEAASFFAWSTSDETAMPLPVDLTSAGGVGVNPDNTGPLQPPGATFHATGAGPYSLIVSFAAPPSARADRVEVQRNGASPVLINAPFSSPAAYPGIAAGDTIGTMRIRSIVVSTGEVSAWSELNIPVVGSVMGAAPNNAAATTNYFLLPPAAALQISSQGAGSAILNYFAAAGIRSDQLEIWRNTVNTPGGTLVSTVTNAGGSITETQPIGSTRYYFARVRNTASGNVGPWSNALLVAF